MPDSLKAVPGYAEVDPDTLFSALARHGWSPDQWREEYGRIQTSLRLTLACRDPWVILAGSVYRFIGEMGQSAGVSPMPQPGRLAAIEQSDIEMLQALALTAPAVGRGPSSPANHVRCWDGVGRLTAAFIRKQSEPSDQDETARQVIRRARLQTLYYRNLFDRPDCEAVVGAILRRCDSASKAELGYPLSAVFQAQIQIFDAVMARGETFQHHLRRLLTGDRAAVLDAVAFFVEAWPAAAAVWRRNAAAWPDLDTLRDAAFQMSEQAKPWIFTLTRSEIETFAEPAVADALYSLALKPVDLGNRNPEHFHLDNPVWSRPYVAFDDGRLFVPLAQMVFSYPFAMMEGLMAGSSSTVAAYEKARADELEAQIESILRRALPDAQVQPSVQWKDDLTGKVYENDLVAVLGNFIFVFEAKSGQIKDASRRGGAASLEKNFKTLFIEPGVQGWRLQDYPTGAARPQGYGASPMAPPSIWASIPPRSSSVSAFASNISLA